MSNNTGDNLIKHDRQSRCGKRRMKSSVVVRDPNGSISKFRQFYQSGGRDYEQYRLWLQTLSKSEQLAIPTVDSDKIKKEPIDTESNIISIFPSSSTSIHSQQPSSMPRLSNTHPLLKPVRHSPIPIKSRPRFSPSQLTTTSFESQIRLLCDHSHHPTVHISRSSIINWSVTDVGRFIDQHFPEKNLARKFIQQKIDGRALPLLTEDHLRKIFKMKLGPTLHLLSLISNIQN